MGTSTAPKTEDEKVRIAHKAAAQAWDRIHMRSDIARRQLENMRRKRE